MFVFWFGSMPDIYVADFAVAKQVLADKSRMNANLLRLLGEALVLANGDGHGLPLRAGDLAARSPDFCNSRIYHV